MKSCCKHKTKTKLAAIDNNSIGETLKRLAITKKKSFWKYHGYYQ